MLSSWKMWLGDGWCTDQLGVRPAKEVQAQEVACSNCTWLWTEMGAKNMDGYSNRFIPPQRMQRSTAQSFFVICLVDIWEVLQLLGRPVLNSGSYFQNLANIKGLTIFIFANICHWNLASSIWHIQPNQTCHGLEPHLPHFWPSGYPPSKNGWNLDRCMAKIRCQPRISLESLVAWETTLEFEHVWPKPLDNRKDTKTARQNHRVIPKSCERMTAINWPSTGWPEILDQPKALLCDGMFSGAKVGFVDGVSLWCLCEGCNGLESVGPRIL